MRKREKWERKKQDRGIVDFMMVTHHFFHSLREWILEMEDPRNQSYITYTQADLGYMAILKNVCGQYSMREMEENFNKETCIDTLRLMSGNRDLNEMPHYDTLNYYLEKLSPECLAGLRKKMITSLIRSKQFNRGRLLGRYWRIIFDGTGLRDKCSQTSVSKDKKGLSETSSVHSGGHALRHGTDHETVPGKIPLGVSFYPKRHKTEKSGRGF